MATNLKSGTVDFDELEIDGQSLIATMHAEK